MVIQAAGLALLAAFSPTALLVLAVFLGAANPRRTALIYLAGALVMTGVMAVIVYLVLRAGHLYQPRQHNVRYEVRLGLGVILLVAGGFLWRKRQRDRERNRQRGRSQAEARARRVPASQTKGVIARLTATPSPKTAFIAGVLIYLPSITFVAAVQVVATADHGVVIAAAALVLIIAITVLFVWLPLLLFLLMPEHTTRLLARFNAWLRAHGQTLVVAALVVGGAFLTVNGIVGVTGVLA